MAEKLFEDNTRFSVSRGIFEILGVSVTEADHTNLAYKGDISAKDNLEHGIEWTDGWKATPGPFVHKLFGRIYEMEINPTDPWLQEDKFTLAPDLDAALRHHIMHAILAVNPNLPFRREGN